MSSSNDSRKRKASENIIGRGENTGNQHFLLFPHVSLIFSFTPILTFPTMFATLPEGENICCEFHLISRLQVLSAWRKESLDGDCRRSLRCYNYAISRQTIINCNEK